MIYVVLGGITTHIIGLSSYRGYLVRNAMPVPFGHVEWWERLQLDTMDSIAIRTAWPIG